MPVLPTKYPLILPCLNRTPKYRLLDALPNNKSAMLYSLSAITSYGHANLFLKEHWQLMGALEALNGTLLFGLTTAFLFAMIREVWDIERRHRRRVDRQVRIKAPRRSQASMGPMASPFEWVFCEV
jgi:hypothetical protein